MSIFEEINFFKDYDVKVDVPIVLTSLTTEEDYEGDFDVRRSISFTLSFSSATVDIKFK